MISFKKAYRGLRISLVIRRIGKTNTFFRLTAANTFFFFDVVNWDKTIRRWYKRMYGTLIHSILRFIATTYIYVGNYNPTSWKCSCTNINTQWLLLFIMVCLFMLLLANWTLCYCQVERSKLYIANYKTFSSIFTASKRPLQ